MTKTEPTAAQECMKCGQSLVNHGYGSECRLFVGPADTRGAEAERAAIVVWLRGQHDKHLEFANHYQVGSPSHWEHLGNAATFGGAADAIANGYHNGEGK